MAVIELITEHKILAEDIDDYGHLNNAAYPRYFETARKLFAIDNQLDKHSLNSSGLAFLVKKATYEYFIPVLCDQKVEIKTKIASIEGLRVFVEQKMFHEINLVAKCDIEYLFFDLASKKPTRVSKNIALLLQDGKTK